MTCGVEVEGLTEPPHPSKHAATPAIYTNTCNLLVVTEWLVPVSCFCGITGTTVMVAIRQWGDSASSATPHSTSLVLRDRAQEELGQVSGGRGWSLWQSHLLD